MKKRTEKKDYLPVGRGTGPDFFGDLDFEEPKSSFAFPRFATRMMQRAMLQPLVDVFQTKEEVVATVELPGVKKEDITLKVSPSAMLIQVKRGGKEEKKSEGYYEYSARFEGYSHNVPLPARVISSRAKATYKNGVLEVRVPKEGSGEKAGQVRIE